MRGRDDGTVIPLLVLGFLLAGTLLTASVAGSAALVAHRRLAADCDGAALAGATALDRTALDRTALDRTTADRTALDGTLLDGTLLDGTPLDGTVLDGASPDGASRDRAGRTEGGGRDGAGPGRASPDRASRADDAAPDRTDHDGAAAVPDAGNPSGTGGLPIDGVAARRAVSTYLESAAPSTAMEMRIDGTTVTVTCRRTARVPFGAVIARPHGIRETATARARTVLRPST